MNDQTLKALIERYRQLPAETEWIEFKEAKKNFHSDNLGKYFSGLSNEANLKGEPFGWLIFGIHDRKREIVGTEFRQKRSDLDSLKHEIAQSTSNNITFSEIYEVFILDKRIIMFQIPAAPKGTPISWKGHFFGRNGESLVALNLQEIEMIRSQAGEEDWSAGICEGATINDLDSEAIEKARAEYITKNSKKADEVEGWDDVTFLNKAKLTIQGKITRTAIILLGKPESEHFLSPSIVKMSWILKDEHNLEKDYEHYGPPLILNTDKVFANIRNLKYRYMPDQSLFPIEINQYDSYVVREALHNCIAHQDYELQGKINIVEYPDDLIFTNVGNFIPQSVENVINQDAPQEYYRNRWLAEAMVNLNMIDTIGSGIKKMFVVQQKRYFPLPDYDLSEYQKVKVRIIGKILDENYTRALINHAGLGLDLVILLDKLQKGRQVSREEAQQLRKYRLIEGRYPNLYVSSSIAAITGDKSTYIKNRAFDNQHYKKLILAFIKEYGEASRKNIDELLFDKLSDVLNYKQKKKKITNLLYEMHKKDKTIINKGTIKNPRWSLPE